jgi:nitrite reductase/ring-hydroxylating ferredoxin subunit
MGAVYAICGESEIPNRKGRGFSLLRVVENGMARPWRIFVVRWDKQFFADVNRCPTTAFTSIGSATTSSTRP